MTSTVPATPEHAVLPDGSGHFERFGGKFVPEALYAALDQLEREFLAASAGPEFQAELAGLLADYTGRPTPITEARRFAEHAAGATILLKREDLNHTGSHKINNVLGSGPADQADGQIAGDRGNRRRPARCGHGHRRRALRAGMHGLHGQGGHRTPGAQRGPDAAARRRGRRGRIRHPDPQRRDERRDAGLGGLGRSHPLSDRHRRRPTSRSRCWCGSSSG